MWVMLAEGAEGHEQERRVLTIAGVSRGFVNTCMGRADCPRLYGLLALYACLHSCWSARSAPPPPLRALRTPSMA